MNDAQAKLTVRGLKVFFGQFLALRGVTMDIAANEVLGIIGPAGSSKTTFLRALNRLNELTPGTRSDSGSSGTAVLLSG